jgi:uncharacterized protein (TIGR02453 family)
VDFTRLNQFLTALKANNNKPWFDENRSEYQAIRNEWLDFVAQVLSNLQAVHPSLEQLAPNKCIFRINKDIRFSKYKSPYKTNFGMQINFKNKKDLFCGYYLHIEPQNSFLAGGIYMPPNQILAAIRQEIDYNADAFLNIIENKALKTVFGNMQGEKLIKVPKGYEPNNPMLDYLKHKSFIFQKPIPINLLKDSNQFQTQLIKDLRVLDPFIQFLLPAMENL